MERGGVSHPLIVRLDNVTKQTGYVKYKTFKRQTEAPGSDGIIPGRAGVSWKHKALPVIPIPLSAVPGFFRRLVKNLAARADFRKRKSLSTQAPGHTLP